MNPKIACVLGSMVCVASLCAQPDDFPLVPEDVEVRLFASEPLVRNPCAITFDARGRLFVGMGPQYRRPTPQTEGDAVYILIDSDGDGVADRRKAFARGLNNIQGMAWRGDQLWIANAPDLTVVKDLDGDDEADEYLRLYTDLGNIEHGLHGLHWAPDGKLYMSKGNSKGLNQAPDRMAPKAFRELWGMQAPAGTPDFPAPVMFDKDSYRNTFHHPSDDWGLNGGILRCNPDGSGLEIVSRGFRNPWDIAYDSQFHWLGTDNDQNYGDKIFSPFYSANFGWGHPWSYDWLGDEHLPSAPSAGPLFEGSGTGVVYCDVQGYPETYRGVFLINDWLRREIYIYRPAWKGAWMRPENEKLGSLARAGSGRSMEASTGRRFDPVDIEIGPDGAIYVSSWGRQYGAKLKDGRMVNEGRIYKIWPKAFHLAVDPALSQWPSTDKRSSASLIEDLDSPLETRRVDAQNALLKQSPQSISALQQALTQARRSSARETWILWTLGRMALQHRDLDAFFVDQWQSFPHRRLQLLRMLSFLARERGDHQFPLFALEGLEAEDARLRHAAVLGLHQSGDMRWKDRLLRLIEDEADRLVYYSAWQAMRDLVSFSEKKQLLAHPKAPVRRAALLSLLEDDLLKDEAIQPLTRDPDPMTAFLAQKRLTGRALPVIKGAAIAPSSKRDALEKEDPLIPAVVTHLKSDSGRRYEQAVLRKGIHAYVDRSYRVRELPEDLEGHTFIRSANADADARNQAGMQFELLFPSTVYVADDVRGERVPPWLNETFKATDLTLRTDDAKHRLYQATFPAGSVRLGSNREGIQSPKAAYIVIIVPELLDPPSAPTTLQQVMALLPGAHPERGRTLFHRSMAAHCSACHQLEGHGKVLAPDLTDIAARAEPEVIVRSILDPSAEITEGFAAQTIETRDGTVYEGLIVAESGRAIILADAAGKTRQVLKSDVVLREGSEVSAMPGGFSDLLSPQQVADIVAYLRKQSAATPAAQLDASIPPSGDPVNERVRHASLQLRFVEDGVEVLLGEQSLARYYHQHPEVQRPFWAQVRTPTGRQVTRSYPPVEGIDATDHAHMHPGLSMGFAVLDGINFWHNREGRVEHLGFESVQVEAGRVAFTVRQRYLDADGTMLCRECVRYELRLNQDGYLLLWDSAMESDRSFYFGVKEEMGLTLRVATPLVVKTGQGRILSGKGGVNEAGTWGKVDAWWDYAGPVEDQFVGVQLMSSPDNPEVWAHSRDYGVLVANPFPVDIKANRGIRTRVAAGEVFRLRFGVQVHGHDRPEDYRPADAYERYLKIISARSSAGVPNP